jgi:hypothetical protein
MKNAQERVLVEKVRDKVLLKRTATPTSAIFQDCQNAQKKASEYKSKNESDLLMMG